VGLSIAGSCLPARDVGGDFYDFYALDDHRIGVFLAEGGNRELGPAMTIAFAKGFLLYTSTLDLTPPEVLRRLQETLATVQQNAGSSISMLYAVIDSRGGNIRFARSGETAQFLINGADAPEEVSPERAGPHPILHGAGRLAPGDAVFFYTDGLAALIARETSRTPGQFFAKLTREIHGASAAELHSAVMGMASKRKQEQLRDDLTAVVIRLETRSEFAIEVVA
jgi:sigma-B regulation protein RsbU (phosphoserine phosphatase)